MTQEITVEEHIDTGHKSYAEYDNLRNIAHIADGLKPSLRKIIHTVRTTLKTGEIKVANLGSRASDITDYAHGETSIIDAVVTLARRYCGSNNLPLLDKQGQFGTMMDNDASEPRYIHVKRSKILDKVFIEDDDAILPRQYSDGQEIEPEYLLATLPMLLINGSRGAGNGYAARILPRKKENVVQAVLEILADKPVTEALLHPSFEGFQGTVIKNDSQYIISGLIKKVARGQVQISCLPPDASFQYENYKNRVLLKLLEKKTIKGFDDNSSEFQWDITVDVPQDLANSDKLVSKFGLEWRVTENLNFWGWDGKIKMMSTPEEVLRYWVEGRLVWLQRRKESMLSIMQAEMDWLKVKAAFIKWVNDNHDIFKGAKRDDLVSTINSQLHITQDVTNRLLSLRITSLTKDDIAKLEEEIDALAAQMKELSGKTAKDLMISDLNTMQ